ncbi:MAG: hypothetical protein ACOYI4_03765 [Christensenellales bacterium]|jgi:hypothetical protein
MPMRAESIIKNLDIDIFAKAVSLNSPMVRAFRIASTDAPKLTKESIKVYASLAAKHPDVQARIEFFKAQREEYVAEHLVDANMDFIKANLVVMIKEGKSDDIKLKAADSLTKILGGYAPDKIDISSQFSHRLAGLSTEQLKLLAGLSEPDDTIETEANIVDAEIIDPARIEAGRVESGQTEQVGAELPGAEQGESNLSSPKPSGGKRSKPKRKIDFV